MVIIYTTDTCPRCKILKKKLESKEIPFAEIQDIDELLKLNIDEVPIMKVDEKLYTFGDAVDWVNKQ